MFKPEAIEINYYETMKQNQQKYQKMKIIFHFSIKLKNP